MKSTKFQMYPGRLVVSPPGDWESAQKKYGFPTSLIEQNYAITTRRGGDIIVAFDAACSDMLAHQLIGLVAHEACHVTEMLFESLGETEQTNELFAYHTGWAAEQIVKALDA